MRYTTWGPKFGCCGHAHRHFEQAEACLKKTKNSDREIREVSDRYDVFNFNPETGPGVVKGSQLNNNPDSIETFNKNTTEEVNNHFTVERRFEMMENITEMVVNGFQRAMIVAGCGGTGKTFNIISKIRDMGYEERQVQNVDTITEENDEDAVVSMDNNYYVKVSGATSATGLYRLLHDHQNSIIVMDDCDSYLSNDNSVNILKAVLDTSGERLVTWNSTFIENLGLPTSFHFNGKVIFISNKKIKQVPQPLLSRSLVLDMDMNKNEIIERARMLDDKLLPALDSDDRNMLFDFVESNVEKFRDVSLRTFVLSSPYIEAGYEEKDWKDMLMFTS